jgi:hypothetical protein
MTNTLQSQKRRSALEAFSECKYRWHRLYVLGERDESEEARRGQTFHACAKHYIRALFDAREASNLELARDAFQAGLVEAPCPPTLFDDVHDLFWTWAEKFELDVDAYLLNEERPRDPDDYQLQLDLAYARGDVLEIPDFKTYWQIWSEDRVRKAFQPRFYMARARRIWPGFQTYRFVMVFVRFNVSVAVEFSAAQLDRLDDQVTAIELAQGEALVHGDFPATPGDHCGYCTLPCPVVDLASSAPVRLITRDAAEKAGGEYVALLQALAVRRKALETFTALHGAVDANGVLFHHKPTASRKFQAAAVVDALRAQSIEPTFAIGSTPVKSYLTAKKWAHVRPAIEALATTKTGSRFTISRSMVAEESDEAEE